MKGIVFTEFLDFVEEVASYDVVDEMIERADPPSGGVYTAIGKYDFAEMAALVGALSEILETPAPELIQSFGRHLFGRFAVLYPNFFTAEMDAFSFLESIEGTIHVEVKKLYPDAELPRLDAVRNDDDTLTIQYESCRPLGTLCIGLIEGCAAHFGEELEIDHAPTEDGLSLRVRRVVRAAA